MLKCVQFVFPICFFKLWVRFISIQVVLWVSALSLTQFCLPRCLGSGFGPYAVGVGAGTLLASVLVLGLGIVRSICLCVVCHSMCIVCFVWRLLKGGHYCP